MYFGWWLVAGIFLVLAVSSGFGFYNLSVYLNVLVQEMDFSVSHVSIAVSLFFLVGGVGGIYLAQLMERYTARSLMLVGALVAGAALAAASQVQTLTQMYVCFTLFGLGNCGVSLVVSTTLITRWFPGKNRSVALSIASTGLSFGGVLITPLSAWWLDEFGYAASMPWFGFAFAALIVPVALFLVRDYPTQAQAASQDVSGVGEGWTYKEARRSRFFILLGVAYVLGMGAQVGGIAHLFNRAEIETGLATASLCIQALTIASIIGRLLGGWIVLRIPIRWYCLACGLLQALGLLLIAQAQSSWQLVLGAGCFGASVGNLLMLQPLWLAHVFGNREYARIFALANAISVIGVAAGPLLLGLVFDASDYRAAYALACAASLFAAGLMYLAGISKESVHAEPSRGAA